MRPGTPPPCALPALDLLPGRRGAPGWARSLAGPGAWGGACSRGRTAPEAGASGEGRRGGDARRGRHPLASLALLLLPAPGALAGGAGAGREAAQGGGGGVPALVSAATGAGTGRRGRGAR